jgi:hypothetical protein
MKKSQQAHTATNENASASAPAASEPSPTLAPDIAAKINTLHAAAQHLEKESRNKLDAAVTAAWQAGKLLIEAKACITRHGAGAAHGRRGLKPSSKATCAPPSVT